MTAEFDREAFDILFNLAATGRAQRVPQRLARAAMLHANVIKNGYVWTAFCKSVGAGVYEVWVEKMDDDERPLR